MTLKSSTLGALRFFEAVARHRSFKRAATELHVTQGAVSQQIKQLERSLGCDLFLRLPRHIALTDAGQKLFAVVSKSLAEIGSCIRSIAARPSVDEIRIRCGPSFALGWLVPRLGSFYAAHPDIRLFVVAAYGSVDPERHEFDVAVERVSERPPGFQFELLMDEQLLPVCTPQYARGQRLRKPADLARCTLLHDAHAWLGGVDDAEWRYWLTHAGVSDVDSKTGQFFTLANIAVEAALAHQGVAIGRVPLIQHLLESGQLVAPFDAPPVMSPARYYIVYVREVGERLAVRSVIAWLHATAGTQTSGLAL
jgi:LysR family transcriptional regulator, glycine cleavage system transcriptional activator